MMDLQQLFLPAPIGGGFSMDGYWVWCGSVIRGEDGNYHMFASRWRKTLPMHPGWLLESEIVRAVSPVPEGPYQFCEVVLPARGPQYWDGQATHNPHIKKIGSDYVLYYMGTTYPFPRQAEMQHEGEDPRVSVARANKRIGIAVSKSIFGPWKRFDSPVFSPDPNGYDNFLVSNPAPCLDENNHVWMIYKSRAYAENGPRMYTDMNLGMAYAETFCSPYIKKTSKPIFDSRQVHLEDPFIWKSKDGFQMIAKDMDGRVCGEAFAGISAHSADGTHWEVNKDCKAYSRTLLWSDGQKRTMGALERPFILFENHRATHIFFATSDGPGGFLKATKTWNMCIPLREGLECI